MTKQEAIEQAKAIKAELSKRVGKIGSDGFMHKTEKYRRIYQLINDARENLIRLGGMYNLSEDEFNEHFKLSREYDELQERCRQNRFNPFK